MESQPQNPELGIIQKTFTHDLLFPGCERVKLKVAKKRISSRKKLWHQDYSVSGIIRNIPNP